MMIQGMREGMEKENCEMYGEASNTEEIAVGLCAKTWCALSSYWQKSGSNSHKTILDKHIQAASIAGLSRIKKATIEKMYL